MQRQKAIVWNRGWKREGIGGAGASHAVATAHLLDRLVQFPDLHLDGSRLEPEQVQGPRLQFVLAARLVTARKA